MKGKYWATVRIPALGTYRVRRSDVNPANITHSYMAYVLEPIQACGRRALTTGSMQGA